METTNKKSFEEEIDEAEVSSMHSQTIHHSVSHIQHDVFRFVGGSVIEIR